MVMFVFLLSFRQHEGRTVVFIPSSSQNRATHTAVIHRRLIALFRKLNKQVITPLTLDF